MTTATSSQSSRQMGRVKWFNTKSGFGFITVINGENVGDDIFAHHSSVVVTDEQYKYLVQGEYVEFLLEPATGGSHKFQATKVTGISGGKLMCETRNEMRQSRNVYNSEASEEEPATQPMDVQENTWNLVKQTSREVETHIRKNANPSPNAGRGRGRPRKTQQAEL